MRNSFCLSLYFMVLLCCCCLGWRWVQLTERRGHRLCLMKSNVLHLPDVSCATDDTQRCCWPAYISAQLFLKLFTFGQTSRSYLTNASAMPRLHLSLSVYLSSATLLWPGRRVACLIPWLLCRPSGRIPKPATITSGWRVSAWGPWQTCSRSRTSTPRHSRGARRLSKRPTSTSEYFHCHVDGMLCV